MTVRKFYDVCREEEKAAYADKLYNMWRESEFEDLEEFIVYGGVELMYKLFDDFEG